MKKALLIMALLAGLGLILGGCSSSTDPTETDTADYEDFGQYEATDEMSADFGDPDLAALLAENEEVEYQDPIALSPVVADVENAESPDIFCFRMIWGNLPRDTGVTDLTDWSGILTISRGAIVVTHTIRFERGQDYILPRYNHEGYYIPEELRWVSKTSCCVDGIATRLYIPPSVTDEVVTVTYKTRRFGITFTMDQLEDLDSLINFSSGNAVLFQSVRCEPGGHPTRGHLAGYWGRNDDGQGVFYGRWMSSGGRVVGTLKGEWGLDSAGAPVFVGKWVDLSGRFRGFVKGTWYEADICAALDCPNYSGIFEGRIYNAERNPIGILKGRYWRGAERPGGYFAGRWCVGNRCFSAP